MAAIYKWSGGTNAAGYWRDDALLGRLDLIYFINPLNKMIVNVGLTYSRIARDERNYNWGTEEMFLEIAGTSGNTVLGSLTWGMQIVDRLSVNASITTSIIEPSSQGSEEKTIGDQYSIGLTYRFGD